MSEIVKHLIDKNNNIIIPITKAVNVKTSDKSNVQAKLDQIGRQIGDVNTSLINLGARIDAANERIDTTNNEVGRVGNTINQKAIEIGQRIDNEVANINSSIAQINRDINAVEKSVGDLNTALGQTNAAVSNLSQSTSQQFAAIAEKEAEIDEAIAEINASIDEINTSISEVIDTKVSELTEAINAVDNKVDNLTETVDTIDEKVDAVDEKVDGLDEKVDALDEKVDEIIEHPQFELGDRIAKGTGEKAIVISAIEDNTAAGDYSHAEGLGTVASHKSQHVFGEYNIADDSENEATQRGNYVEVVGNGTSDSERSNVRTLDWGGNEWLANSLTIGSASLNEDTLQKMFRVVDFMSSRVGIATSGQSTAQSPTVKEKMLEQIIWFFNDKADIGLSDTAVTSEPDPECLILEKIIQIYSNKIGTAVIGYSAIAPSENSNIVDVDRADYMILSE